MTDEDKQRINLNLCARGRERIASSEITEGLYRGSDEPKQELRPIDERCFKSEQLSRS